MKKKSEEISTLTFLLNFSQDFEKIMIKEKTVKIGMAFLPNGILIKEGE